jgi:competence protein ComEC
LFPIAAYVFSRVTAAGLLVNFAAIPCMTVVQVAAMLTVAVSLLSASVAQQAGLLTHIAATGLVESGRLVDLAPWLARRVPAPAPACLIGYYVAALVAIWSFAHAGRRRRNTTSRVACGVASVAMVVIGWAMVAAPVWPGTWPSNGVRVTFIDVGQGDAALVQTPGGFSMLVDAGGAGGGRFDIGGRVVAPVLWTQGVRRLDVLVVTHGDADHVAGAEAIVRDFMPREIWEGVPVTAHAPLVALRRLADRDRVPWRVLQRGDRVSIDGVSIRTLHPPLADWERQRVRNDDSVALEVRQGDVSIVLPGDIEAAAEQSVSAALEAVDLRLIEAPHHGSASSSTEVLLDAARPRAAVISAGRGNRYGHPHAVVLERLGARHVDVYRTDRDGAVVVGVAGGGLRVETFSGRRASYPAGPPARAR